MKLLRPAIASLCLVLHCLAAPGGTLVPAISDEFDILKPMWTPGLRGMPESLTITNGIISIRSVDNGDDPYPSAEDMITSFADQIGRSLNAAEKPSVVAWVWLPPFAEWPTGTNASGYREWFGLRVIAYDQGMPLYSGLYWPGIYVATDDAGPCFIARVGDGYGPDTTIGRINAPGWWTLGLSWNAEGRTEYYAAPGRVTLTQDNLLYTTPTYDIPDGNRSLDQLDGLFVAIRMTYPSTGQLSTNWMVDTIRVYVQPQPERTDFNGDLNPDLVLFNPATRQTAVEYLRGSTFLSVASGPGMPPGWQLVKVSDFDGDGKPDYFLFNPATGSLVVWKLSGMTRIGSTNLPSLPPGWQLAAVADVNADGKPDLVLLNPTTRSLAVWLLDGATLTGAVHITQAGVNQTLPAGWNLASAIDFNGDGKPDLVLYNPTTRQTAVWYLDGAKVISKVAGPTIAAGWSLAGVADFTADGKPDFLISETATRRNGLWTLNGLTVTNATYIVDGAGVKITQPAAWNFVAP